MDTLTPRQEFFCISYLETGIASEAYRQSYNTKNMKPTTVHRNAKALLDNTKIAARLAELRAPAVKKARVSLEQHLLDLQQMREQAMAEGDYSAAIKAEYLRGKAAGLYDKRVQHDVFHDVPTIFHRALRKVDEAETR